MSFALRRDTLTGAVAGLIGGIFYAWALQANGKMSDMASLIGLMPLGANFAFHFLVSAFIGASFGAVFHYYPGNIAATVSVGILYGLLWWILGPLTLSPLLMGRGPTWALAEAGAEFFNLIGHLLYGGVTGLSYHLLATMSMRWLPQLKEPNGAAPAAPKRIVILGGGFGGISAAQRLEQLTSRDQRFETTLVSQSNYLLFTPMLAEVASSSLEPQHISAPVRAACPHTRFLRGAVVEIDTKAQTVQVNTGVNTSIETLSYDHLVLALGSVPNFFGLPGVEEHAFVLKSLEDATRLRNHVIAILERADMEPDPHQLQHQLTFIVAGGGFAGTEMIAEMFDLVHSVLRYYPGIEPEALRFLLIHSSDRILPELSPELAEYALRKLQARGIEFMLNARVAGASAAEVILRDGSSIPTRTLVWTAGNRPNPVLTLLPCERNERNAVKTEITLQVKDCSNIWAIGDCAQIPDTNREGQFHPPTAQHALREGKVVAENIVGTLRGSALKPFRFKTIGLLVALGHRTGVAEIWGRQFSGLLAWLMWRAVYLSKLPGLEKKVRVMLDWTIDLFFARDIVLTVDTTPTLPHIIKHDTPGER